ncbi:MAG: hypothetical protein M3124_02710 [Actinomycetota bacterium]|nr:hypothetical protein [Actinomycetota bacterium]
MPRTRKTFPSIVAALDAAERSLVLDELLAVHPELAEEGDEIARALLSSVTVEEVAEDLRSEIELLDITDLASRAGRQPGRGYVHETEAAYELVEEVFRPFVADMQRRAQLGLSEAARAVALGTITGLYHCRRAQDGTVLAYSGEDTVFGLAEEVRTEAGRAGIDLPVALLDDLCPEWDVR